MVGRARTHVSNLAHFLKTPLTVLSSEAAAQPGPLADAVKRQVDSMRRQVDHYLARARAAGALDVLGNRTKVKPVLDDLARVLRRIHAERGIDIEVDCPPNLSFRGERQDLEEMAGNLIDNACKWARKRVSVRAIARRRRAMELTVEDDGPGLERRGPRTCGRTRRKAGRKRAGFRAWPLDRRRYRQALSGFLTLGHSRLGGLEAKLNLPAIA